MWVFQGGTFDKDNLDVMLECPGYANKPILGPYCGAPFPFFLEVRICFIDYLAQSCQHLAAPIGQVCNLFINHFRWIRFVHACTSTNKIKGITPRGSLQECMTVIAL